MPRYARLHAPGTVVHVIARFVDHEFRLAGDAERAFYLAALGRALGRTDWVALAYALMSSHVHLALQAGLCPPEQLLRSLHTTVAQRLNRVHGRLGPVFAGRATTIVMPTERLRPLAGYLHNNPVRAGVVAEASASSWTSHRAWLGIEPAPPWLHVDLGLHLAGFSSGPAGRTAFDDFVRDRRADPRDAAFSVARLAETRRDVRTATALPVELTSPIDTGHGSATSVLLGVAPPAARWHGDIAAVLSAASAQLDVHVGDLCSRRRTARIVAARRLAALVGVRFLRRDSAEIAAALAISAPSVTALLRPCARLDTLAPLARRVADELRADAVAQCSQISRCPLPGGP